MGGFPEPGDSRQVPSSSETSLGPGLRRPGSFASRCETTSQLRDSVGIEPTSLIPWHPSVVTGKEDDSHSAPYCPPKGSEPCSTVPQKEAEPCSCCPPERGESSCRPMVSLPPSMEGVPERSHVLLSPRNGGKVPVSLLTGRGRQAST